MMGSVRMKIFKNIPIVDIKKACFAMGKYKYSYIARRFARGSN